MTPWRIVCDIGGTNVRLARAGADRLINDVIVLATQSCASATDALRDYAGRFHDLAALQGAAVAAAGPLDDGRIELTNHPLSIAVSDLRSAIDGRSVRLLNDLEAVAWSLPWLKADQIASIRSPSAPLNGPRLVVNVGTGFGGALLVQTGNTWHSIACEPGHMKLASRRVGESGALLATASVEEAISGLALARKDIAALLGAHPSTGADPAASPATIFEQRAFNANFSALLGQVCGDLVLASGAWGGINFCGSVATAWLRQADLQAFFAAFESKGPMASRMTRVRVNQILAPHPALIGLAAIPLE